jgi:aspartate/methionine/tyrosine aminotransferase
VPDLPQKFSRRTAWDLAPSDLSTAIAAAKRQGGELIDLTVSNPTACGFHYNNETLLAPLANPLALTYDPDPRGLRSARESVATYYADHGAPVDPNNILLTTSTSEAYSFLFRLLCDPGDEVLVAQPSYPLFDFLATLDDITLTPYPLFYDYGWWIDFAELERRITPRTRAILVVHPNNPTGHWTQASERQRLEELCVRHNLALIVDEVFLDYPIAPTEPAKTFATGPHPALTFVLSGISKIAALPQMKVAWLATFAPDPLKDEALARLEVISDTFLSMNAPAQFAVPTWLATRHDIQRQIRERVAANLSTVSASGLELLHLEAGWAAVLKLREPDPAMRLLEDQGVVVHPGSFYGMTDPRLVVVSLLTPEPRFAAGIRRVSRTVAPFTVQWNHASKHRAE